MNWIKAAGPDLLQGDLLSDCLVPILPDDFGLSSASAALRIEAMDLLIITQSCDLANLKTGLVALCPVHSLRDFEKANPAFAKKGVWEEVRKGRREGLHLLTSPTSPESRDALVTNFREIFSLPIGYLRRRAQEIEPRWRLQSPYLEHFSQSFARFFMRVGLPSAIPPFTD